MIRRPATALALGLALACGSAALGATEVRIPGLTGAKASVRLVLQSDRKTQVIGFDGLEWATTYSAHDLAAAATVALTPTADIATVGGKPTCYLISVSATGGRGWTECVQVPDSPTALELADLVGLSGIDPASLWAGRLLATDERAALNAATSPPDADNRILVAADIAEGALLPSTTGAEEGWSLVLDGDLAAQWAEPDPGCTTLTCLTDGPSALGTAGQVLATAAGGASWNWITPTELPSTVGAWAGDILGLAAAPGGGLSGVWLRQGGLLPTTPSTSYPYILEWSPSWGKRWQPISDALRYAAGNPPSSTPGQVLALGANPAYWTWISPLVDAPLTGGPYSRSAGTWVEAVGPQGPAGADGAPGPAGADGAQGPQGDPGPTAISADADNALSLGTDSLTYLDEAGTLSADERDALDAATAAPDADNRVLVGADTLVIPVYDLGDIGDATVPVTVADDDVRKIYTAATTSDGTLTITPPAAGMRVTTLYLDGDGEHETALASTADLYWQNGNAIALISCYGERMELWATCLPTRCQMATRTSSPAPVYATATTDPTGANNAIDWTMGQNGIAGAAMSIEITDPTSVSTPLSITLSGSTITIACQQNSSSVCISTAAQVIAAMPAGYATGANAAGNNGNGTIAQLAAVPFSCAAP
jgi:hypothetical protein